MLFCLKRPIEPLPSNNNIVFLHGFLGKSDDWELYLDHFSNLRFNAIAIDLPGHGKSPLCELEDFFNHIPYRSHIVGYSLGGRIALMLSALRNSWFTSFTLISTNPGLRTQLEKESRLIWENQWVEKLKQEPINQFVTDWYSQSLFSTFTPPEKRFHQNSELLVSVFRKFSIAKLPPLWDHLQEICQPIQMIFGEVDNAYMKLKKEIEKINTTNHIKLTSLENCSHPVHLEASSLLIKEIEKLTKQAM